MLVSGISSELKDHQMAFGGVVSHSSPPCRSRRALEPTCRSRRAGFSESARGIWIVVSSFGIARLYLIVSGIGFETRGSLDAVKEIGQDGMRDR